MRTDICPPPGMVQIMVEYFRRIIMEEKKENKVILQPYEKTEFKVKVKIVNKIKPTSLSSKVSKKSDRPLKIYV